MENIHTYKNNKYGLINHIKLISNTKKMIEGGKKGKNSKKLSQKLKIYHNVKFE